MPVISSDRTTHNELTHAITDLRDAIIVAITEYSPTLGGIRSTQSVTMDTNGSDGETAEEWTLVVSVVASTGPCMRRTVRGVQSQFSIIKQFE